MNSKLTFVLGLAIGGAVGAVASWHIAKNKYKKIADEEIASVKEVFAKNRAEKTEEPVEEKPEVKMPVEIPEEYIQITKKYTNGEELTMSKDQRPYTIDPEEFGDHEEYDTETLVYYSDGVLAKFSGEVVEDVGGTVGSDSLNHFGENENDPDTVYVRNDILKADYEILRDVGKFSDNIAVDNTEE